MSNECRRDTILCVGISTLDIINVCDGFPHEDSDVRPLSQRWQRGGNASNNCTVFTKLLKLYPNYEFNVEYMGTLADDYGAKFMREDYGKHGIITENVVTHEQCSTPTSSVIINAKNGSRTIVHQNKDLPELSFESFSKLCLKKYKLIHFEGRNCEEVGKMIRHIREVDTNREIKISLDIEKLKKYTLNLLNHDVDLIFIEKDFAFDSDCNNVEEVIKLTLPKLHPNVTAVYPWGELGATAIETSSNTRYSSAAFPPKTGVIDTLGAGDTFLSSTLFALEILKYSLNDAIAFGCRVAGAKCGFEGYKHIETYDQFI